MRIIKLKRQKRARKHGFRSRQGSAGGRAILTRRRQKNRKSLTVTVRRS